jgi:hypothetical protein
LTIWRGFRSAAKKEGKRFARRGAVAGREGLKRGRKRGSGGRRLPLGVGWSTGLPVAVAKSNEFLFHI